MGRSVARPTSILFYSILFYYYIHGVHTEYLSFGIEDYVTTTDVGIYAILKFCSTNVIHF
jgi:hypothetical protein